MKKKMLKQDINRCEEKKRSSVTFDFSRTESHKKEHSIDDKSAESDAREEDISAADIGIWRTS